MKTTRPVFLNLWQIRFPVMAIVSILHRVSGVALFLFLPFLLYLLHGTLVSEDSFNNVMILVHEWPIKIVLWLLLSAIIFHFIAGIRHLLMDCGFAESLQGGRIGAIVVLILSGLLSIVAGVWLCMQ